MRRSPPTYSPTTNCQPRKMAMMIPSSTTRLVEASRKARDGISPAPLAKSARVPERAAKLHEELTNPKNVPMATERGPASPIFSCIVLRVTKTWIIDEIR